MPLSRRSLFALDFSGRSRAAAACVRVHRTAMACRFEIALAAADRAHVDAAGEALDEAQRVERLLDPLRDSSDIARINRTSGREPSVVSPEVFALLQACATLSADTGGAFDVTMSPLGKCWAFVRHEGREAAPSEIAAARAAVGMDRVMLDPASLTVTCAAAGAAIGLGGIAKGYALDRMAGVLRLRDARHALLSSGGSTVVAMGGRDKGWLVDVRPARPAPALRLRLRDGALGTSGVGAQFVLVDGARDGRVIDPRTGFPARAVRSATVVAADAATADALSTAFLVGGPALAGSYCAGHPQTLAVLTMNDTASTTYAFGAFSGATLLQ